MDRIGARGSKPKILSLDGLSVTCSRRWGGSERLAMATEELSLEVSVSKIKLSYQRPNNINGTKRYAMRGRGSRCSC